MCIEVGRLDDGKHCECKVRDDRRGMPGHRAQRPFDSAPKPKFTAGKKGSPLDGARRGDPKSPSSARRTFPNCRCPESRTPERMGASRPTALIEPAKFLRIR